MLRTSILLAGLVAGTASAGSLPTQWHITEATLKGLLADGYTLASTYTEGGQTWAVVTKGPALAQCPLTAQGPCSELVEPHTNAPSPPKK